MTRIEQKLTDLGFEYDGGEYSKLISDRWAISVMVNDDETYFVLGCYNYYTEYEFRNGYRSFAAMKRAMDRVVA